MKPYCQSCRVFRNMYHGWGGDCLENFVMSEESLRELHDALMKNIKVWQKHLCSEKTPQTMNQ